MSNTEQMGGVLFLFPIIAHVVASFSICLLTYFPDFARKGPFYTWCFTQYACVVALANVKCNIFRQECGNICFKQMET